MSSFAIVVQLATLGIVGWGAYLCFAKRDRRLRERRRFGRGGRAGRRRADLSEAQVEQAVTP